MKTRAAWLLAVLIFAALVLPFFLAAPGAHPATDDFTFAAYTGKTWQATHSLPHVLKDALSYALRTWRDWQGTVTGVVVMTLNPAVFSLPAYWLHAPVLLGLHIAACLCFLAHFARRLRVAPPLRGLMALGLTAISLLFLPDMTEGIYWFNGAWFYTGANAVALLLLTAVDRQALRGRVLPCAALGVVAFLLGMDNYITAMMTAAALFFLGLSRLYAAERRAGWRTLAFLLPLGLGLALSVIAPGNAVRMAADGAHEAGAGYLAFAVVLTMREAAGYLLRFAVKTPLLALLLALTPALAQALPDRRGVPPIPAVLAALYLLLCAMIIPHVYASGYAGSGRVVNLYHMAVVLGLPFVWVLALRRLSPALRKRIAQGRAMAGILAGFALVLCLALGQGRNYAKLIGDRLDGTQAAYIAQFEREYALCRAAGEEKEVLLPRWTVQTLTGKPTVYPDPDVWTNRSMADYFGLKSVRTSAEE